MSFGPGDNATVGARPCCARRARDVGGFAGPDGAPRGGSFNVERVMPESVRIATFGGKEGALSSPSGSPIRIVPES